MAKVKVNLTIDSDLKRRALTQGIRFSDVLETQLKTLIPLLEERNCAAKCPACGAWTTTLFSEKRRYEESQYLCAKCGEVFWSVM